jgi:L-iditol 2-dehydrogenase
MQSVYVRSVGCYQLEDAPRPVPGDHDVLIRVLVTGVCRTDLKLIEQGHRDLVLPRIPGEEVVGIVEQCGSQSVRCRAGDLVYVYPGLWCGTCDRCRRGASNLCRHMQIMGFHRDGRRAVVAV